MLFKFKSKVAGDLLMLEPNGKRVLEIMGKDPSQAGIILPAQMSAAINALEKAIQAEEAAMKEAKHTAKKTPSDSGDDECDTPNTDHAVPLRQRTLPFLELLKKCLEADVEIVWGV